MQNHDQIDRRSLALAQAVADKIDAAPDSRHLDHARRVCQRWREQGTGSAAAEWAEILDRSWDDIKRELLNESEDGRRLRQSSPFCGVLTPQERWAMYRHWQSS